MFSSFSKKRSCNTNFQIIPWAKGAIFFLKNWIFQNFFVKKGIKSKHCEVWGSEIFEICKNFAQKVSSPKIVFGLVFKEISTKTFVII